jgi:hypothetical protein
MIGFVLMMVFLLGYICCSAVESFVIPPDEPDATTPSEPEAEAGVDAWGRVRAYKATGPYYKESSSPLDAVWTGQCQMSTDSTIFMASGSRGRFVN